MTNEEIYVLSTEEERFATKQYEDLQEITKKRGYVTETELLLASQIIRILAARNERLGLTHE